jgi:ribosomal protein L37E
MSPRNASGAAPALGDATSRIRPTTPQQDDQRAQSTASIDPVVVFGTEHLPSGNAQFPRVEVTCRRCGFTHFHIKYEVDASTIVRSPACARHTEYTIEIVNVKPTAVERRRGAA